MAFETPPLGKYVVQSYDAGNKEYPIVIVQKDPKIGGYVIPNSFDPCVDPAYPNHIFTGPTVSALDGRTYWQYMILPGPWVPFTRWDDFLGPIQGRRRSVKNTGQYASQTGTQKTTYESRDNSDDVSWEIEELWSNGSGTAGNPLYPSYVTDFYDDDRGPVQQSSQLVVATGLEVGSLDIIAGVVTEIRYEQYGQNPVLLKKIVETWSLPGPIHLSDSVDPEMDVTISRSRQIVDQTTITSSSTILTSPTRLQVIEKNEINTKIAWKVISIIPEAVTKSEATALEETVLGAQQFPGRIDIQKLDQYGSSIGYRSPRADLIPSKQLTWWVISATKPTISVDEIFPDSIEINGVKYADVLHDLTIRYYNGFPVIIPATVPSFSQYVGTPVVITNTLDFVSASATVTTNFDATLYYFVGQLYPADPSYTITAVTSGNFTLSPVWAGATQTVSFATIGYTGGWVGTEKIRGGRVTATKYHKLWRLELIKVLMR